MAFTVQKTSPKIQIFSNKNTDVKTCVYQFCDDAVNPNISSKNLQSYVFQKSVDNFTGSFNLSIKEEVMNFKASDSFLNKVEGLDIVTISEDGLNIDFIGVITTISYTGTANGLNKIINVSGKSIEYLFEYVNIPLDCTAMAWTKEYMNTSIANINSKLSNKGNGKGYSEPVLIKSALISIFNDFKDVAQTLSTITNTKILELIQLWYGTEIFDCPNDIKFKYPISSNLLTDGNVNYINYIRNILPKNVYEMYGIIRDNKPYIRVRQVPFSNSDWIKLPYKRIDPDFLIQYTLTKSIEEVYTVFYSYIEGSAISPEFYEKLQAIEMGENSENAVAAISQNKINKYGYSPLKCNFVGFKTDVSNETKSDMKSRYKELNIMLRDWYGDLDTMYDATIVVIRDSSKKQSLLSQNFTDNFTKISPYGVGYIGEKLKFMEGEFYITGVEHSWSYGKSINITFHCERGGAYDVLGKYHELKNISKPYGEMD